MPNRSSTISPWDTKDYSKDTLFIREPEDPLPLNPDSKCSPDVPERHTKHRPVDSNSTAVVLAAHLPDRKPLKTDYTILDVECKGEFSYWLGFNQLWHTDRTIINVEQDMEFSDDLVGELLACKHPLCAFPYQVYPTMMGHYIYCATTTPPRADGKISEPRWVQPGDEWAVWSSIGFCKITPEARPVRLDKQFWQWLEHSINRVVTGNAGLQWHLHWSEIKHYHDYEGKHGKPVPDHLW